MLSRAPRFWPNARCWSAQCVRNLSRVYAGGRVANFRPVVARNIFHHYSRAAHKILDFSAGYGGRLLAALSLEREYIGLDPARKQVSGNNNMLKALSKHAATERVKLIEACAEDFMPTLESGSFDLVFSSPPFHKLEVYSEEATQSSHRYPDYQTWKEMFLERVLVESKRVLRRRGVLAINISSRKNETLEEDAYGICSELFDHEMTIRFQMTSRPLHRSRNSTAKRFVPVYIFRKR